MELDKLFLERILYIGNEMPESLVKDKRDKFILLGTPQYLINEAQALIDSAKREELESLPFAHDTMGFCEHFGKQFRPCAKCVVDKRLAELKQSEESE